MTETQVRFIYLSGPISLGGILTIQAQEDFKNLFIGHAGRLRKLGYTVENPCELRHEPSWEAYMRHGMRAVANADLVLTLPRWRESRGAMLEVFVATQLGIPVLDVDDFPNPGVRARAQGDS